MFRRFIRSLRCRRAGLTPRAHARSTALFEALECRQFLSVTPATAAETIPAPIDATINLRIVAPSSQLLPGSQPRDLVFDPTRNQLLVTYFNRVERYNASTGNLVSTIMVGSSLWGGDITEDGKYLYVSD